MKITVDRIEGDIAVCEIDKGRFINIDVSRLSDVKEGNVYDITLSEAGDVTDAKLDDATANARKEKARSLFDKLKKK